MPDLYKDPETGIWKVSFKGNDGKTHHRSTGCREKGDAEKVVKDSRLKEMELAAKAKALTAESMQAIISGRRVNCKSILGEFSEWSGKENSGNTARAHTYVVKAFLNSLDANDWPATKLTADHIRAFVNAKDAGSKHNRDQRLAGLRAFFSFASARAYCIGNPSREVTVRLKEMTVEQRESKKRVPFTKAEYQLVMNSTTGFWRWATALSYWTGLRMVDCASLEWASIRADSLLVFAIKDGDRIWVPLNDPLLGGGELVRILLEISMECHGQDPLYCFPSERERLNDPARRSWGSVTYGRILQEAGIEGKSFHCLRHAFATRLKNAGVSIEEIAKKMGHSSTKTTAVYANH